jgi:tetratricopeptide (TPR) repeat protein
MRIIKRATETKKCFKKRTTRLSSPLQKYYERGIELINCLEYERAIAYFSKIIERDRSFKEAWYMRGNAHYAIGFYERAVQDFRIVIKQDKNNYLAWEALGKSLQELEAYDKAQNCFDTALEIRERLGLSPQPSKLP